MDRGNPGSTVWEQQRAAIEAKIAERHLEVAHLQLDAAETEANWVKVSAIASIVATAIALIALLAALF